MLRIFPLSQVVLFLETRVPLYVFEPRYRAMTSDALAGDHLIGMVAVPPQNADALAGDPPVFEIGCAGRIEQTEARPDGTYAIALAATQRFRIVAEPPRQQLYRIAQVEYLDDVAPSGDDETIRSRRAEILSALRSLISPAQPDRSGEAPSVFAQLDALDDARFVNTLAQKLDLDVLEKQRLLESGDVTNRYDVMVELMRFRLAAARGPTGSSSDLVH